MGAREPGTNDPAAPEGDDETDAKRLTDGGVRELNSVPLTGLDAAREALDHYTDEYNDGELYEAEGGDCLIILSRSATFQHFSLFQECQHVRIGNVRALYHPYATQPPETRLKVELREVSR